SRHGLALTLECTVFGWGAKQLTNLPADVNAPKILPFLNNLGVTGISCSNTHSAAWHSAHVDVYTWGMPGPWLGFEDKNQQKVFGRVDFHPSVQGLFFLSFHYYLSITIVFFLTEDKNLGVSKVECGTQYTLILLTDGLICTSGVNEHGRMGIGQDIPETAKPMFLENMPAMADMSAGPFHAALLSRQGEVFTFGVGADYRLGHGNEETQWIPKQVEILKDDPIVRIECVEDRTFAITKLGLL
ncbi:regulator of chromosome condensation family protein, partial [Reticulomyxa filosa]